MQALVIGSSLVDKLEKFNVVYIDSIVDFEESKNKLNLEEPCLIYLHENTKIEDPEDIWNFHKIYGFSAIKINFGRKEEICSFNPKSTFYKSGSLVFDGMIFSIKNKKLTLELPANKIFSVITCIGDKEKYDKILLPSLHKANSFLSANGLDMFETVCVYGKDFKTIGEAYNHGISIAKSNIKIFVHEDLDLMDPSWVLKVLLGFSDPDVGLLGVVGSTSPSYEDNWWMSGLRYIYGKQYIGPDEKRQLFHWNWDAIPNSGRYGMLLVDGCFLATNRNINFDTTSSKFFMTPYEHDLGNKILDMNLKIGVIKHLSWHYAYPKKDLSKIAVGKEIIEMIEAL